MYGYFYDNSNANRDYYDACPYIVFKKVNDTPHFQNGDAKALADVLAHEYKPVQDVARMYAEHCAHSFFDPTSGNTLADGTDFFKHVMSAAANDLVTAFVFDWDRTLQQFECMSTQSFEFWCTKYGATTPTKRYELSKAMAIYHSGGSERFHKLKHMFAEIQRHGKLVNIITANPAVRSPGRALYLEILNQWGLKYFRLEYATQKYLHMANDPMLQSICGPHIMF